MDRSLKLGRYTTENSDLMAEVIQIHHINDEYVEAYVRLSNKKNGYVYEDEVFRLHWDRIKHWRRYEGNS